MPASSAGPASAPCPKRTRDPNQLPSKVDSTAPDRLTAPSSRSDQLETNLVLEHVADAGQLKRALARRKDRGIMRCLLRDQAIK